MMFPTHVLLPISGAVSWSTLKSVIQILVTNIITFVTIIEAITCRSDRLSVESFLVVERQQEALP